MTETSTLLPLVTTLDRHVTWAEHGIQRPLEISTQGLSDYFSGVTQAFNATDTFTGYIKGLFSSTHRMVRYLNSATYSQLKDKEFYVPLGFTGNLYEYVQVLTDSGRYIESGLAFITDAIKWMGSLNNDPDQFRNRTQPRFNYPDTVTMQKALKPFFDNTEHTTQPFGAIVMNVGQYRDALLQMNELSDRSTLKVTEQVHQQMTTFVTYAKLLVEQIEDAYDPVPVSKETHQMLSALFKEADVFFSMTAILLYNRKRLAVALQDNEALLKKFVK